MKLDEALEIAVATDPGRVRSHNEDSIASDAAVGLVVLADGMGGYHAGEVASAVAVTRIYRETRDGLATLVPGQIDRESGLTYESLIVRDAIRQANIEVHDLAAERREYSGMGTTVVAALFYDNHLTCAHAGDSRMYSFSQGRLDRITEDHSVVREFMKSGMYSEAEARASFNPGLVTRALGVAKDIEVEVQERKTLPGDIYMICSDGLTNMVSEDKIRGTLGKTSALDSCAWELVRLANKRGGDDNISVALIRVVSDYKVEEDWQTKMAGWFNR
jgi:protein phosphatase